MHSQSILGVAHLKEVQDACAAPADRYIRKMVIVPARTLDPKDNGADCKFIICMMPAKSRRLFAAQHIQSDIAFKRVKGFLEFEIAQYDTTRGLSELLLSLLLTLTDTLLYR